MNGLRDLLVVKENYLNAAYNEMERLYGGFKEFVEKGLGFSAAAQERLQANLLE